MANPENEIDGQNRILNKPGPNWLFYALIFLGTLGLGFGLCYLLIPESLARIYGQWQNKPLEISSLALNVGRQRLELPPNSTIEIHPGQQLAINGLLTNRWLNYDLRLACRDFPITSITGGAAATPKDLLPGEEFEQPREIKIEVWENDKLVGEFNILSRFSSLDFAARGDVAATQANKVENYQKALAIDPGFKTVREKLINVLLASGQKELAAEIYEEELARNGPDENLLLNLLAIYGEMGHIPRKVEALGHLIDLSLSQGNSPVEYRRQLAQVYKEGGWPIHAAEIYESLLANGPPDQAQAHLTELVGLYHASRQTEREIDTLKRLVDISPPEQTTNLWMEIAALYDQSGDFDGKLAAWRALAELMEDGDDRVNTLKIIARMLSQAQRYDEARQTYQEALKITPDDLNLLLNLARVNALGGNREAYRDNLTKIVTQAPDNLDFRRELAEACVTDKKYAQAKEQYLKILKLTPDDQATRLTLIDILEKSNDKNGLIKQYGEMATANPNDKVIAYNYGVLLFEKKDWAKSIEAFKKVLELDQNDGEARDFILVAYQNSGQKKEMLETALELYRRNPAQHNYLNLMLNTHENAKDWVNFAKVAEEATKIEPDNSECWRLMAKAQNRLNQKEQAAQSLWKVAETAKDKKIEAWFQVATAFTTLKKTKEVRQAYQKILEIDPQNKKAGEALLKLEKSSSEG